MNVFGLRHQDDWLLAQEKMDKGEDNVKDKEFFEETTKIISYHC